MLRCVLHNHLRIKVLSQCTPMGNFGVINSDQKTAQMKDWRADKVSGWCDSNEYMG